MSRPPRRAASFCSSVSTSVNRSWSKSTRSILFTAGDKVLDAQQLCDPGVPAGLAQHTGARVDQQDRDVGVGRAGEHVAGVALVAGCVGQDVAAGGGGEEPVGDVDRDALFAFGAQAVGQRGQVGDTLFVGDGFQVVQRQAVGVVQEPPDQGALAVVHRTCSSDPQQLSRDVSSGWNLASCSVCLLTLISSAFVLLR